MALLRRRETTRDTAPAGDRVVERTGPSPGIVRALFTLAGVAAAGFLLWLAQLWDLDGTTGFWIAMAIVAGAGVALGFSQIFGGWTKWGIPTMSPTVFLLAFLPTLVLGGWILLARQPEGGWQQSRFDSWSGDLGVTGFVDAMVPFLPVIALVIGLVFAFSFDTTGPRTIVERDRDVVGVPEEDVHDYRREEVVTRHDGDVAVDDDRSVAERLRDRDDEVATTGTTRVEHTDRS